MKFLKRLIGKTGEQAPAVFTTPIRPNRPLYVVGDIHGRADLLDKMLEELSAIREADSDLVFAGDIVDRGEESALTLSTIKALTENPSDSIFCLDSRTAFLPIAIPILTKFSDCRTKSFMKF